MLCIFTDASTVEVLEFHDVIQLFTVDTCGVVYVTVGIGHCQDFATHLQYFLGSVLSHVTRTGNQAGLALEVCTFGFQHFQQEVDVAVTRGFRTNQRTAEFAAFSRKGSGKLVSQFLVHAEHETYFAATYTDVTGRNVGLGTDVAPQLQHESLNETHHLCI